MDMFKRIFINIYKLMKLLNTIDDIEVNSNGDILISVNGNLLITSPKSIGLYAEDNLILESDLLAQNTLGTYSMRNVANTAALMTLSHDTIVYELPTYSEKILFDTVTQLDSTQFPVFVYTNTQ